MPSINTPKVLLIEDDEDQTFLITAYLEGENFQVDTASNIAKGIELYNNDEYLCAVVDVMMPDGGAELLLKSVKQLSHPVFILTAAREDLKEEFVNLGAALFCTKQEISTKLLSAVKALRDSKS